MDNLIRYTDSKIQGVLIQNLNQIENKKGAVLHMLRADSPIFSRFGEVYFSLINPGMIKAWKRHKLMTQHFAVPMGQILLVIYDDRIESPTHGEVGEFTLGRPDHYFLVRIPPMVWYGFQGLATMTSLVANCSDLPHDPQELEKRDTADSNIPYRWK